MKAAAIVLCVVAAAAMGAAIRDMVVGTAGAWRGWTLRAIALGCFGAAVALNAAR